MGVHVGGTEQHTTHLEEAEILRDLKEDERHAVAYMVEALCYKPEGHGFDSR
jgi:hypothetical protein